MLEFFEHQHVCCRVVPQAQHLTGHIPRLEEQIHGGWETGLVRGSLELEVLPQTTDFVLGKGWICRDHAGRGVFSYITPCMAENIGLPEAGG